VVKVPDNIGLFALGKINVHHRLTHIDRPNTAARIQDASACPRSHKIDARIGKWTIPEYGDYFTR
jgi:hypothetical protein